MKQWYSAKELVGVAGVNNTPKGIIEQASREGWEWRPREGQGGGKEYAYASLPKGAQAALALRWWTTKTEGGREAIKKAKEGPPSAITYAWEAYECLPKVNKAKAQQRTAALMALITLEGTGLSRNQAIATLQAQGAAPNRVTVFRWLKKVERIAQADWLPFLASRFEGGAPCKEIPPEILKDFYTDYLRNEIPGMPGCYRRAKQIAAMQGVMLPSMDTFKRRLKKQFSPQAIILAREGPDALSKLIPAQKRSVEGMHALELVNADGHILDVLTEWPGIEKPVRPVLLAIQDVYSRKILAWRIGLTENTELIHLAFADLLRDWGVPEGVLLDNGRAFASKRLTGGISNRFRWSPKPGEILGLLPLLGCIVRWAQPYSGQSKPIERFFRALNEWVAKHPFCAGAYTGKDAASKPANYGSRVIPIAGLIQHINEQIPLYNAEPGRTGGVCKGRSLDEVFAASYAQVPITKATQAQQRMFLLQAEQVLVDKRDAHVNVLGNRFWDEKLIGLMGKRVTVRFDPHNPRAGVDVEDAEGRFVCSAECEAETGFISLKAAKETAKARRNLRRSTKKQLADAERLTVVELTNKLEAATPSLDPPPTANVIQGMFKQRQPTQNEQRAEVEEDAVSKEDLALFADNLEKGLALKHKAEGL